MKLNDFIQTRKPITETIDSSKFKEILKVFLPIAKKIIQLDKMPDIVLRKIIHDEEQPTMGRFNNETYSLELAIANRQPVDALRTLAHELVHAKQHRNHVNIDPTTGSPEENEANEIAGIVMREFNKIHPEFLTLQPVQEGGNQASHKDDGTPMPGWQGIPGQHQAQELDLKVHDRTYVVGVLSNLLHKINDLFASQFKEPLWHENSVAAQKFLSGSTAKFFDKKISDEEFVRVKPKVGDIDTQAPDKHAETIKQFLTGLIGKQVGDTKFIGFSPGNSQYSSMWQVTLDDLPVKLQIDFEYGEHDAETGLPTEWQDYSHSSSWDDLSAGIKGVFHKYIDRALPYAANVSTKYVARVLKKSTKISDEPVTDSDFSFAVSGEGGGGVSQKYIPYNDPNTGEPMEKDGIPVMQLLPTDSRQYIKNLAQQFEIFFGQKPNKQDQQLKNSFIGTVQLATKYLDDSQRTELFRRFVSICFEPGSQMITKNDPVRDRNTKMAAIDYMVDHLKIPNAQALRKEAINTAMAYEQTFTNKKAAKAPVAEAINEADNDAPVKAQLRKGMPHLRDLKPADLLDLIDEIHDGNGNFKLQNIPLNVKVDGFGGRFGKDKSGKPFMGTSNTPPRYEAGFVKYHQQKGTTDPDILGRAQLFDDLFEEMMQAIKMVDSKLGKDFLINKQVTCEVLFLPFATETPEGKLKFVGIHYDKLPDGVQLALVPFRVVDAESGEDLPDTGKVIKELTSIGREGSVMFINNSLTQNDALDVTAIVPPLENIEQIKSMLASGKLAQKREAKEILAPVAIALEKAIIEDPNIIGKDMLGKDYEGIVLNTRLGPVKVTSQEQRKVIADKLAAKKSAREERPRENANKTAVVAIGSFVGHIGHEQLFDYTIKKAQQVGGDPYLFIGNAEGKADPIPPSVKVQTWHKMYPEYAKQISTVTQEGGSLLQKIKHELINPLPGKPPRYDNIIIMVGEDQAGLNMPQALMKAVNKFQGYEHVKVSLEATPRGTGMSFTKLRNILKDPNATPEQQYQTWAEGFDEKKLGKDWILYLMDLTRKGMGIQPKKEPAVQQPNKIEEPAVEGIGPMNTPLRRFMIKQIARITGRDDLDDQSDGEIEDLFAKYVPGSEKKIEKFNHAMQEFSGLEYQDRMAGVGMGDYVVDETKRMSARVKLQRAWDRERAKSSASNERERMRRELQGIADRMKPQEEPKKDQDANEDQRLDPKCWKGYRKQGTKMKGGTRVNNCIKVGEGWEEVMASAVDKLLENFADGKNPGRKGLAKRSGVNTKASVSDLRKTAKHSTGEKARMAHWLANMKAGRAKK